MPVYWKRSCTAQLYCAGWIRLLVDLVWLSFPLSKATSCNVMYYTVRQTHRGCTYVCLHYKHQLVVCEKVLVIVSYFSGPHLSVQNTSLPISLTGLTNMLLPYCMPSSPTIPYCLVNTISSPDVLSCLSWSHAVPSESIHTLWLFPPFLLLFYSLNLKWITLRFVLSLA
jgi:hypothetical protein